MSAVEPLAIATRPMTTEEFLAWEAQEELRWEFDGWRPLAMTGASVRHHRVIGNLREAIRPQLPAGCETFTETFKLQGPRVSGGEPIVRYPDVMVTCQPLDGDDIVTDAAVLVVEVLSPSSVRTDRVEKLADYGTLPELEAYLVVDPAVREVTLYRRHGEALVQVNAGDPLDLGHGLRVTFDQIYRGVIA